jgi:broad specificity phosphatase PhoE
VLRTIHSVHAVSTTQGVYFFLVNTGYADYEFNTERNQWLMQGLTQPSRRVQGFSPRASQPRFVFLRHGQSEGNVQRMFQGQHETPLTKLGRTQAIRAGKSLKEAGYRFNAIISSPMERALETATLVNKAFGIPLSTDDRLKEVHNGILAGMTIDQILDKYPDDDRPDQVNPYVPIGETGESITELYLRAGEMVDELLKRPPGEYLVVAHGALLNNIVLNILGTMVVPRGRPAWLMFRNTSYADLAYRKEKNLWELMEFTSFEEQ